MLKMSIVISLTTHKPRMNIPLVNNLKYSAIFSKHNLYDEITQKNEMDSNITKILLRNAEQN